MADGLGGGAADPWRSLVRIRGLDGRVRGYGFLADPRGTVLTGYEVVAGASALVLEDAGGARCELGPDRVTALPEYGLALLAGGHSGTPLPVGPYEAGQPVLLPQPSGELLQGLLAGTGTALAPWPGPPQLIEGLLLLDLTGLPDQESAGLPVLDAAGGAVIGLLAPGLRGTAPGVLPALPVAPAGAGGRLGELLARNAETAPGYGRALNLGGALDLTSRQLAAASAGPARIAELAADRVDRPDGLAGEEPQRPVTVLVGEPGSGRSSELAALAVRRAAAVRPLPTLWLRGADLRPGDRTPAEALDRALAALTGERNAAGNGVQDLARVCAAAGRPLLVVLDGPEEAPAALGPDWQRETVDWLRAAGARLLTACRPESWEHEAGDRASGTVQSHRLGPLRGEAAERAARHYAVPCPSGGTDPLALRLAGELLAAGVPGPSGSRAELYGGRLDLYCLRIAQRIADLEHPRRPAAHRRGTPPARTRPAGAGQVRRLAAAVAGRVHEAARRMLGPGQGGLGPEVFEELFPSAGGWARAVLAEGLFVVAGDGYRLAHEELADWLQGLHLDLDGALRLLLAEDGAAGSARTVPRHRAGAVASALRTVGETRGPAALDGPLDRLRRALESAPQGAEAGWWAARLLAAGLRSDPDPTDRQDLLAELAETVAERAGEAGGFARLVEGPGGGASAGPRSGFERFGPAFWAALPLEPAARLDLLRVLVRADGPEQGFLAAAAALLRADPGPVLPLLCRWFADGHGLPVRPGTTVADLAQDLMYAHRALAVDELTEALVAAAHPRADALLSVLAVEEPSALCRAVDRWSHDPRPERHVAAAVHAVRVVPYAAGAGALLLRHAALALLAREQEPGLHGAALAVLVRDPRTRAEHLAAALQAYRADDQFVTAQVLGLALDTDQEAVLAAFEARLGAPGAGAAEVLRVLRVLAEAGPTAPRPARPTGPAPGGLPDACTRLVGRLLRERPERAEPAAEYLARRLALGTAARGDLTALIGPRPGDRPASVRRAFALVLAAPGAPGADGALRQEFLDRLLTTELDPGVLAPVLERLALTCAAHPPARARAVVQRITDAWQRAPRPELDRLDTVLVRCAGRTAGFAQLLAEWPAEARPPAGGPLLARLRELVADGRDPQYAAAEAEREPAVDPGRSPAGVPVPGRGPAHGRL